MNPSEELKRRLAECPLIAIIRGVTPEEAAEIGAAIYAGGIRIIEVPLNSPRPLDSIRRLADSLGERALVGAGTVLDPNDVARVSDAGGRIVVSPDTSPAVIEATVQAGLISSPGYFTPSEAFTAIRSGAHGLKLFPAEAASPAVVKAQKAVLPPNIPLLVVGGVKPDTMQPWLEAGANGFGLGGGLYRPGQSAEETGAKARAYVDGVTAG
ncbi:MAG TPA: 2-dehydro-3-deoxy-6-phosphogalactonate aldolase [Allosphingosinicella sp.]|jgi:2-dehydro-3-deoxyphosphogalactonate aldolase|nr:2-dehydro-3-deoxy-6-phosphogalactonate aldolase [Allosphingosinicella sp.]